MQFLVSWQRMIDGVGRTKDFGESGWLFARGKSYGLKKPGV